MTQVLLVEDDLDLATTVVDYLELEDIVCDHAANGTAGYNLICSNSYQVIITDINMPSMDGISLCQKIRQQGIDTPILMLTAMDSLEDKQLGFDAGTDDYLVKPFALQELVMRIQALAKRRSGQVSVLEYQDLLLDLTEKQAKRGEQVLRISPTGLAILESLMRASPQPLSREQLISQVWGDEQPDSNSLKVHMHNLRKAINLPGRPSLVQTIAGVGFALRAE